MAHPDLNNGKYFRISNELFEAIYRRKWQGAQVMSVYLAIIRLLYGWNKKEGYIQNLMLAKELNIPSSRISEAISILTKDNLIIVTPQRKGQARKIKINKDFDTWVTVTPQRIVTPQRNKVVTPQRNSSYATAYSLGAENEGTVNSDTIPKDISIKDIETKDITTTTTTESNNAPALLLKKETKTDRKRARIEHWNSKSGLLKAKCPPSKQLDNALNDAMGRVTDDQIDTCVDNFYKSKAKWVRNVIESKGWGFYKFLMYNDGINLYRFLECPIDQDFNKSDGNGTSRSSQRSQDLAEEYATPEEEMDKPLPQFTQEPEEYASEADTPLIENIT